jgi:hypothetical protein
VYSNKAGEEKLIIKQVFEKIGLLRANTSLGLPLLTKCGSLPSGASLPLS